MYAPSANGIDLERDPSIFLVRLALGFYVEVEIGDYCVKEMGQSESENVAEVEEPKAFKRTQLSLKRRERSSSMPVDNPLFNPRKRSLLEKSWRKTPKNGLENIGARLFLKLERIDPDAMRLFDFHASPKSDRKYQKSFQKMAMTFTRAIDYIITNMHDEAKITKYCRDLGKRHVRLMKRGFRPSYWNSFGEALTECAIDWEAGIKSAESGGAQKLRNRIEKVDLLVRRETLVGWRALVTFIIREMRSAFMEELRDRSECTVGNSDNTETAAMFRCLRREMEQH
uniref:Globin family profile domain-containing protein n=1 Tax=Parascaris univalens TaxID=6257 RepID=A0A915AFF6_PARUN